MRTIQEIIEEANKYLELYPTTTDKELGIALNLSPRFTKKLIESGRLKRPEMQESYQS
jgi:hypothetical protein